MSKHGRTLSTRRYAVLASALAVVSTIVASGPAVAAGCSLRQMHAMHGVAADQGMRPDEGRARLRTALFTYVEAPAAVPAVSPTDPEWARLPAYVRFQDPGTRL